MEEVKFKNDNEFATKECIICIDEFTEGQKLARIPNCRHFFHKDCVKDWLES